MDKDMKLIIDQLRNNEDSSDREMALFLSSNTPWGFRELYHLVDNVRTDFLNLPIHTSKEEQLNLIYPYLD